MRSAGPGAIVLACSCLCVPAAQSGAPTALVTYRLEAPVPDGESLNARFTARQVPILEMLNRADREHLPGLPALVVPDSWHDSVLAYSPFPMDYGSQAHAPKLLIVDQRAQAFGAYEAGRLVRWGPVSSGRRTHPTPAGLFHLNWRSRGRHSTVNPRWFLPWYFNFHNERGLSFHEYDLPGRPASHACVRLLQRDAQWLFGWGETWTLDERGWTVLDPGTPVLILNCYDFDAPPVWRSPVWLASGIHLPSDPGLERRPCTAASPPSTAMKAP